MFVFELFLSKKMCFINHSSEVSSFVLLVRDSVQVCLQSPVPSVLTAGRGRQLDLTFSFLCSFYFNLIY